jgi:hypothetical protein
VTTPATTPVLSFMFDLPAAEAAKRPPAGTDGRRNASSGTPEMLPAGPARFGDHRYSDFQEATFTRGSFQSAGGHCSLTIRSSKKTSTVPPEAHDP